MKKNDKKWFEYDPITKKKNTMIINLLYNFTIASFKNQLVFSFYFCLFRYVF